MKWFIVLMGLVGNQPAVIVEDNQPFDTPSQCEQARARLVAEAKPGRNPVRAFCGMNAVAADFMSGRK